MNTPEGSTNLVTLASSAKVYNVGERIDLRIDRFGDAPVHQEEQRSAMWS